MVQDPRVSHQLARLGGVYRDPSRVDRDASTLLKSSVGVHLQPIISMYADPSAAQGSAGASQTVLVLQGTIAIHFRGNTYQLLVDIYLLGGYPIRPPVCYVRLADATMYLKPNHKHVGSDGKVYLPYLHEWAASSHNLVELVVAMSSVFSADPPVFSRPAAAAPTPSPAAAAATTMSLPVVASLPTGIRTANASTITATPISSSFYMNSNGTSTSTVTATAINGSIRNGTPNSISSTYLSQQQQLETMLAQEAAEANAAAEVARQADEKERQKAETLRLEKQWEQAKIVELRTKLQAKVRQYCYDQSIQIKRDVQQDYRDSEMLELSTTNKVQYQLDLYQQLKTKLEQQIQITNQRTKDIEVWLEENQKYIQTKLQNGNSVHHGNSTNTNNINVDTAVVLKNTFEEQMLNLSSENSGLQDALYYLDRALYNGDIDSTNHLKHVRNVAKQQFYTRALLLKVQQMHHTTFYN